MGLKEQIARADRLKRAGAKAARATKPASGDLQTMDREERAVALDGGGRGPPRAPPAAVAPKGGGEFTFLVSAPVGLRDRLERTRRRRGDRSRNETVVALLDDGADK